MTQRERRPISRAWIDLGELAYLIDRHPDRIVEELREVAPGGSYGPITAPRYVLLKSAELLKRGPLAST